MKIPKKENIFLSILVIIICIWVFSWMWIGRHYVLDDAFIHLRYGEFLWDHGWFSGDGVHKSFPSSVVFTALTAALQALLQSDWTTKYISEATYICLLVTLGSFCWQLRGYHRLPMLILIVVSISPMAMRWLTDGMETSLVALGAVWLAAAAVREAEQTFTSVKRLVGYIVFGCGLVLLRVELAWLIAFATMHIILRRLQHERPDSWLQRPWSLPQQGLGLAVGGLLAIATNLIVFGHLLPDTAAAKTLDDGGPATILYLIAHVTGSAFSFGVGLWVAVAVATVLLLLGVWNGKWSERLPALVIAAVLPATVTLIVIQSQQIQAIRHISWVLYFACVISTLYHFSLDPEARRLTSSIWRPRLGKMTIGPAILILVASWSAEAVFVYRIQRVNGETFERASAMPLEVLRGELGIAFDVGLVMYFTKGRICDGTGLINGRERAELPADHRLGLCLASQPSFLFVTPAQYRAIAVSANMNTFTSWRICEKFLQRNVRINQAHMLIVEPTKASAVCPEAIGVVDKNGRLIL